MYNNGTSNGGDATISPLELESLASNGESKKGGGLDRLVTASLPSQTCDKLLLLIKLYFELYPKIMLGASALLVGTLLYAWSPWQGWGAANYSTRNYMTHDYTSLTNEFNFQTAQIDHWCLFGGDDRCFCEDPTEAMSRAEVHGWSTAHKRNKKLASQAVARGVDVVFFGDQNVQSWDGKWLDRPAPEGRKIARLFNETFVNGKLSAGQTIFSAFNFKGVALGIYGDRINNILWRIQHGELPQSLNPKVFWLVLGTNDLALGMCSEEVVTLGIMRIAEEVHHLFPDSIVVIQGILPRSNHKDGSLEGKEPNSKRNKFLPHHGKKPPLRNNKRVSGGGADLDQYMPMAPGAGAGGGRQLLQGMEGMYNPMDEALDQYLEQYDNEHRQLQDLTTPNVPRVEPTTGISGTPFGSPKTTKPIDRVPGADAPPRIPGMGVPPPKPGSNKNDGHIVSDPSGTAITWDKKGNIIGKEERKSPQPYYDYYLWPSIKAINKELEGFCAKHEHFVYFDADQLVLGSVGNAHYKAAHQNIITDLMPNYVHLSFTGHQVVMGAVNDELKRIIYDDNEANDIEKKDMGGRRQT